MAVYRSNKCFIVDFCIVNLKFEIIDFLCSTRRQFKSANQSFASLLKCRIDFVKCGELAFKSVTHSSILLRSLMHPLYVLQLACNFCLCLTQFVFKLFSRSSRGAFCFLFGSNFFLKRSDATALPLKTLPRRFNFSLVTTSQFTTSIFILWLSNDNVSF